MFIDESLAVHTNLTAPTGRSAATVLHYALHYPLAWTVASRDIIANETFRALGVSLRQVDSNHNPKAVPKIPVIALYGGKYSKDQDAIKDPIGYELIVREQGTSYDGLSTFCNEEQSKMTNAKAMTLCEDFQIATDQSQQMTKLELTQASFFKVRCPGGYNALGIISSPSTQAPSFITEIFFHL